MTSKAINEYLARQRERYQQAGRAEKGRLLSEMGEVTGMHRKALIRHLNRGQGKDGSERGRPRIYGDSVASAAAVLWLADRRAGPRHLKGAIPNLLALLAESREFQLEPHVAELVARASASTLWRLLKPVLKPRRRRFRGGLASDELRRAIPVKTSAEWKGSEPGYLEADLVAHCGGSMQGFHLWTLTAVDVASGWLELVPLWGRNQRVVVAAVHEIRRRLPIALRGLDTDNGTEFINHQLRAYCRDNGIEQTRSRPFRKNDASYVEQKNGAVIRLLLGHRRLQSPAAYEMMRELYELVCLHHNFVRTHEKVVEKRWSKGGKQHRRYDQPQTPYERLLVSGVLGENQRRRLEKRWRTISPLQLAVRIDHLAAQLRSLREPSTRDHFGNPIYDAAENVR